MNTLRTFSVNALLALACAMHVGCASTNIQPLPRPQAGNKAKIYILRCPALFGAAVGSTVAVNDVDAAKLHLKSWSEIDVPAGNNKLTVRKFYAFQPDQSKRVVLQPGEEGCYEIYPNPLGYIGFLFPPAFLFISPFKLRSIEQGTYESLQNQYHEMPVSYDSAAEPLTEESGADVMSQDPPKEITAHGLDVAQPETESDRQENKIKKLRDLKSLYDDGILNDEEYETRRSAIVNTL